MVGLISLGTVFLLRLYAYVSVFYMVYIMR